MRVSAALFLLLCLFASDVSFSKPTEQVFQVSNLTGEPEAPEPVSDAYRSAYQAYKTGRAGAGAGIKPFEDFIASNSNATSKAEAQFWLGMAYIDAGRSALAGKAFYDSHKTDPKGRYAPLALFKLGSMLYSQNQLVEACAAWDLLELTFTSYEFSSLRLAGADRRSRFDCPNKATTASTDDIGISKAAITLNDTSSVSEEKISSSTNYSPTDPWTLSEFSGLRILATKPVLPKAFESSYNCESGQRRYIVIFLPEGIKFHNNKYEVDNSIKTPMIQALDGIYDHLRNISPLQCNKYFILELVDNSGWEFCKDKLSTCGDATRGGYRVGTCTDTAGYAIGGICTNLRFDTAKLQLTGNKFYPNDIIISSGAITRKNRLEALDQKQNDRNAVANSVSQKASVARAGFKKSALARITPADQEVAKIVLDRLTDRKYKGSFGGQCFDLVGEDRKEGSIFFIECKSFVLENINYLTLSSADQANGITARARANYSYIWYAKPNWVDGRGCYEFAKNGGVWLPVSGGFNCQSG